MADFQKQKVQWFPGHMAKTRRQIKEMLPLVDGVVELLDARVPYSSANPELDTLVRGKPRIVLLNKCDVADPAATKRWIAAFEAQGKTALAVDCRSGKGLSAFGCLYGDCLFGIGWRCSLFLCRIGRRRLGCIRCPGWCRDHTAGGFRYGFCFPGFSSNAFRIA